MVARGRCNIVYNFGIRPQFSKRFLIVLLLLSAIFNWIWIVDELKFTARSLFHFISFLSCSLLFSVEEVFLFQNLLNVSTYFLWPCLNSMLRTVATQDLYLFAAHLMHFNVPLTPLTLLTPATLAINCISEVL